MRQTLRIIFASCFVLAVLIEYSRLMNVSIELTRSFYSPREQVVAVNIGHNREPFLTEGRHGASEWAVNANQDLRSFALLSLIFTAPLFVLAGLIEPGHFRLQGRKDS